MVVAWAAAATDADSVSVTLHRRGRLTTAASNSDAAARLDADQYTTGQGPCVHATTQGQAALVPSTAVERRWPHFLPHARNAGIAAILSTPITVGAQPVGALNLYSPHPDAFGPAAQHTAQLIARHTAAILAADSHDPTTTQRLNRSKPPADTPPPRTDRPSPRQQP